MLFFLVGAPNSLALNLPQEPAPAARDGDLILRGIDLLYNWEFEAAEACFRKEISRSPERPDGYFYLAMVTWSRLASGYWSASQVKTYERRIDRTIHIARARVEEGGGDALDHFFLGGALGFKARFQLMRSKWFSSFLLASEAVEALKRCREMDPSNSDVLFGLGIFEYYTARLSGALRWLSALLIHKGDKVEGLKKLHTAATRGRYSATEAKSLLIHIYLFLEKDIHRALPLTLELSRRYPANPRYPFLRGVCYARLNMDAAFEDALRYLKRRALAAPYPWKRRVWERRVWYLKAVDDLMKRRWRQARSRLQGLLEDADPETDPSMIAWPLLKIGMSYDLAGDRAKALGYYDKVLSLENGAGAQFFARKLKEDPPEADDPFIGY